MLLDTGSPRGEHFQRSFSSIRCPILYPQAKDRYDSSTWISTKVENGWGYKRIQWSLARHGVNPDFGKLRRSSCLGAERHTSSFQPCQIKTGSTFGIAGTRSLLILLGRGQGDPLLTHYVYHTIRPITPQYFLWDLRVSIEEGPPAERANAPRPRLSEYCKVTVPSRNSYTAMM